MLLYESVLYRTSRRKSGKGFLHARKTRVYYIVMSSFVYIISYKNGKSFSQSRIKRVTPRPLVWGINLEFVLFSEVQVGEQSVESLGMLLRLP